MANELAYYGDPATESGLTVVARIINVDGSQNGGDVSTSETGSTARYVGNMPAVSAGSYGVQFFDSTAGTLLGQGQIFWDGTAEVDSLTLDTDVDAILADTAAMQPTVATNLDAAVSSRLATTGYTAPDNAGITANGAAIAGLNNLSQAQAQSAAAAAITAASPIAANVTQVASAAVAGVADFQADVSGLATSGALATVDANVDAVLVDTGTTIPAQITGLNNLSSADAQSAAAAAITAAGLATQATADQILVDTGTTIPARLAGIEGTTFNTATDSLEAIRDRGDTAWITGSAATDWSTAEREQIRDALGVDGAKTTAVGGQLQAAGSQLTTIDNNVDSVLIDTGATIPAQITALNDLSSADAQAAAAAALTAASPLDANVTQVASVAVAGVADFRADTTGLATAGALATVDSNVDAVLTDTGTTIPAQITALNDPTAAAVATAVRTELSTELGRIDVATSTRAAPGAAMDLVTDALDADAVAASGAAEIAAASSGDVNVTQVGGVAVASPGDLQADVSTLATSAQVAALNDPTATAVATAVRAELSSELGLIDAIHAIATKERVLIDNITYDANGLATSQRIRLFATTAQAAAATSGGTGEGETLTIVVTASPDGVFPQLPTTVRGVGQ